jgi:hypothetical protein
MITPGKPRPPRRRPFALDEAFTPAHRQITSPGHFWAYAGGDGTLRVTRADPVVWCTAELLEMLHAGECHPGVTLACPPGSHKGTGDVIRVGAAGETFIYQITGPVPGQPGIFEARWPD